MNADDPEPSGEMRSLLADGISELLLASLEHTEGGVFNHGISAFSSAQLGATLIACFSFPSRPPPWGL